MEMVSSLLSATLTAMAEGPLETVKVMLYINDLVPSKDIILADLTEATFTGYARSAAVTWGDVRTSIETGLPVLPGDEKTFLCSGGDEQVVFGYALVDEATTPDTPLTIHPISGGLQVAPGTGISIVPRVGLSDVGVVPSGDVTVA